MTTTHPVDDLRVARGATLEEIHALLLKQRDARYDVIVSPNEVRAEHFGLTLPNGRMIVDDHGVSVGPRHLRLTPHAAHQLADRTRLTRVFDGRLRGWHADAADDDNPAQAERIAELWETNINELLAIRGGSFRLRAFVDEDSDDGICRAVVSTKYAEFDNLDVLTATLQAVHETGLNTQVSGVDLSDTRMYVRIDAPEIRAHAGELFAGYRSPYSGMSGDDLPFIHAGLVLTNSEVGMGAVTVSPRITAEVCSNGMTMTKELFSRRHVGKAQDDGVVNWSDRTRDARMELITTEMVDTVRTFLSPEFLEGAVARLTAQAAHDVNPEDVPKILEAAKVSSSPMFTDDERDSIFGLFARSGQFTAGGVGHAVTALAQHVENPDRAAELESLFVPAIEHAAVCAV